MVVPFDDWFPLIMLGRVNEFVACCREGLETCHEVVW
jgi:hypothetical protein